MFGVSGAPRKWVNNLINAIKGDGWTNETIKGNATSIASLTKQSAYSRAYVNEDVPRFIRHASNPIFAAADTATISLYWPWLLQVDELIQDPLGKYYLWYSTDHLHENSGISLAYSDSLYGPWTEYETSPIYFDPDYPGHTETPSIIWNEKESLFYMYYHNISNSQCTCLATSSDGITWTKVKNDILRITSAIINEYVGDNNTSYFTPFRIGGKWCAYTLKGGNGYTRFALCYSDDGVNWQVDPRLLGWGMNITKNPDEYISWNHSTVFLFRGQLWWIGLIDTSATTGTRNAKIVMARISEDLRTIISPLQTVIDPTEVEWEDPNIRALSLYSENNKIYLFYECADKLGIAVAEGV